MARRDHSAFKALGECDMDSNKLVNVTDPTAAQDAATKKYVDDSFIAGFEETFFRNVLDAARWATATGGTGTVGIDTTASVVDNITGATAGSSAYLRSINSIGQDSVGDSPILKVIKAEVKVEQTSAATEWGIGFDKGASDIRAMIIHLTTTTDQKAILRTNDDTNNEDSAEFDFSTGSWHNVSIEVTASDVKAYVDGILVMTNSTKIPAMSLDLKVFVYRKNNAVAASQSIHNNYIKLTSVYTAL